MPKIEGQLRRVHKTASALINQVSSFQSILPVAESYPDWVIESLGAHISHSLMFFSLLSEWSEDWYIRHFEESPIGIPPCLSCNSPTLGVCYEALAAVAEPRTMVGPATSSSIHRAVIEFSERHLSRIIRSVSGEHPMSLLRNYRDPSWRSSKAQKEFIQSINDEAKRMISTRHDIFNKVLSGHVDIEHSEFRDSDGSIIVWSLPVIDNLLLDDEALGVIVADLDREIARARQRSGAVAYVETPVASVTIEKDQFTIATQIATELMTAAKVGRKRPTRKQLADKFNVSEKTITRWLKKDGDPTFATASATYHNYDQLKPGKSAGRSAARNGRVNRDGRIASHDDAEWDDYDADEDDR